MTEAMLGKIEQALERILDNSRSIDSYHYYLLSPGGMERLESTCMLLMAIGEGLKGIDLLRLAAHPDPHPAPLCAEIVNTFLPAPLRSHSQVATHV